MKKALRSDGICQTGESRTNMKNSPVKHSFARQASRHWHRGFTLIELLVVIVILAILAAILLPVLSKAKMRAWKVGSISNLRQLQLGATMYANDNESVLLPNAPWPPPLLIGWVDVSSMAYIEGLQNQPGNTNRGFYTDALLAPYLGNQLGVYKSPADRQQSFNGDRIRSYSMNGQMGCVYLKKIAFNLDAPAIQFCRESDIVVPSPGNAFVFCEESPYTINDGYLQIASQRSHAAFPDVPASYLGGGCAFSFADGHAEAHKWVTSVLLTAKGPNPPVPGGPNNADWAWFTTHAASNP